MPKQKYRKAIFACRIVTISSALMLLIFIAILWGSLLDGDMSWTYGVENVIYGIVKILSVGVFIPPFVIIGIRLKIKEEYKK